LKPVPFHIPKTRKEVFRIQADSLPYFYDRLHEHTEIQITLIEQGEGTLIAGDYVGRFRAGDVFVLGKHLPHVFRCDDVLGIQGENAVSISVIFDESYAGYDFWEAEELFSVREWLYQSGQGYSVAGSTRKKAAKLLQRLSVLAGIEKLIAGLDLLQVLSNSSEIATLSHKSGEDFSKELVGERMDRIVRFTFQESHRSITIDEVAALVALSPSAFCRYFKLRTRKTYLAFLNELRISHACRLLITTDKPIALICENVGFNNLSHFNKLFRKMKDCTPSGFRTLHGTIVIQ
jgi:AraC-like DNA-binding protein